MYKSPVEIIEDFNNAVVKEVMAETENQVYKAIYNVGVNVDKGELLNALAYDRDQYDKGYVDGKADAIVHAHWEPHEELDDCAYCSHCNDGLVKHFWVRPFEWDYCPNCGAIMDEEV